MTHSLYVKYAIQIQDLYLLYASFKNSLLVLRCLNTAYPETILMLNKVEEEADEIRQNIDVFSKFLFNENVTQFKVYEYNEKVYIKNMFEKLHRDLSASSNKIIDLKQEHYIDDIVPRKRV